MNKVCPICGELTKDSLIAIPYCPGYPQHRCNPKKLKAIDTVMGNEPHEHVPSEAQRLNEGLEMNGGTK